MSHLRRSVALVLVVATVPLAAQTAQDWDDLYREAIRHVQRREWKPAEDKLLAAIKAGPKSGRGVIRRFMDRDDYFPEFYMGVVYLNTSRVGAALAQFQLARKNNINPRSNEFRQLADLEARAKSLLDAEARSEKEKPDPRPQFKTLMDQAQKFLSDARYDEAESSARQARGLNVDNEAADTVLQNIERGRTMAAFRDELAKAGSVADLKRMLSKYEGKGVPLDELRRRIAAGEAAEVRARGERSGMIEFFAGNYQRSMTLLAEAEKAAPLSPRGHFYRACSLASLATRGKVTNQNQLKAARQSFAIAAQQIDALKDDLRYVSPRLIQLLKGA